MKIHCSSLGKVMTSQVGKTDKQKEKVKELYHKKKRTELQQKEYEKLLAINEDDVFLSTGAKTHMKELVEENVYGVNNRVYNKFMSKGTTEEPVSIDLFNEVYSTNYEKHVGREINDWISGECDILSEEEDLIIDIKSSWSTKTFPKLPKQIDSKLYEWQGRGYMMLYERSTFTLAYCMVNTPDDLIGYEPEENHIVDDIDPRLRVTCVHFTRDLEKEEHIKLVVDACIEYADEYEEELLNKMEL